MRTVFGSTIRPSLRGVFTFVLSLALLTAFQLSTADYADAKKRKSYKRAKVSKKARHNPRFAAYVIDAKSGKVLHSRYANAPRYPASLTKMMTLYLVFEDLKSGRIKKSSRVVMTKAGARRPPSKIGLRVGRSMSMEQAILSLVTKSANDVATAIGDKLSGSEAAFAKRMTRKARQLGMNKTTFKNASGLTARGQITTAADMAKLGLALREHHPRFYKYFQTRQFRFGKRRYGNHNKLLGRVRGVDGIKTGYTRASGFNLVSSVSHGRRKIVAVVMGGRSGASRNAHMTKLINQYLRKATKGPSRRLIAKARSSRNVKLASVSTDSKKAVRVTAAKTNAVASKANQLIASRISTAHTTSASKVLDQESIKRDLKKLARKPQVRPTLRASADHTATASVASTTSNAPVSGWQIQIAASDSKGKLMEVMQYVRSKNRKMLSGTKIHTPIVNKNGVKLWRGRFVGFESKTAAVRACKIIKQQQRNCLALNG